MEENNRPEHIHIEYRTRNILSLAERVEVIREYDRQLTRPSLQSLAAKFDCSSKQIKNILINRDSLLSSYENADTTTGPQKERNNRDNILQKRQEKITFLGKVIYEFIQRALFYNHHIDDDKVRQKALQIKECIAVENFQPTSAWLEDFKKTYSIPAFDWQSLRNNIVITEAKKPHLSAIDMIEYVSRKETEDNRKNLSYSKANVSGNDLSNTNNQSNSPQPHIVYEVEDEEEDEELQKLSLADEPPKPQIRRNNNSSQSITGTAMRRGSLPFPDIESVDEALKHVQVLEEYAMLQDNYRAIGLLTQLEQIFKKQMKKY